MLKLALQAIKRENTKGRLLIPTVYEQQLFVIG